MTGIELASWSFPVLLALIFIRVPIGLAMAVCGLVGAYFIYGSHAPILNQLKQVTYSTFSNYNLSVIPLFLLMGQFAALGVHRGSAGSPAAVRGAWRFVAGAVQGG